MKAKIFNYRTLFFLFGILTLTYLINKLGFQIIIVNIAKTGWWFSAVLGLWLIIYLLNALAWFYIIGDKSKKIGFGRILKYTISGFAINYITPLVSLGGEPYKVLELNKHLEKNYSIATVISYNMMHIFSHFFFWLTAIFALLINLEVKDKQVISLIIALIICLSVIYLFYAAFNRGIVKNSISLLTKLYFTRFFVKKLKEKQDLLESVDKHIMNLYSNRKGDFYLILLIEYLARIVGCIEFYFILKAISINISLTDAFLISAGSSLFANMFFFIPMQIGSRESGFYLVFQSLKLTPAIGVYVSLMTRIREFFWILIGLILIKIKPKHNIIKVENLYYE